MVLIERIERLLFDSSRSAFIGIVLFVSWCKSGISYIPNIEMSQMIAANPFRNPFTDPYTHYLYWNWLSPFVAWLIGADTRATFFLFHLVLALAFTALFIVVTFRRLPERQARTALLVFAALPVSGTIYYWVGMDAAALLLILIPLVFHRSPIVPLVAGIALGMQHAEQGIVAAGALLATTLVAMRMRLDTPYSWKFSTTWMAGIVTGKILLIGLFAHWGVVVNDGRMTLFGHEFRTLLLEAVFHFQFIVWSMLGVGWFVLIVHVDRMRRAALPFVVGLSLCLPFLVLAQDETRVISIITFPVVYACWLSNRQFLSSIDGRDAAWLSLLWLVIPWSWAWLGIPRWSALPYDLYWFVDKAMVRLPRDWLDAVRLFD